MLLPLRWRRQIDVQLLHEALRQQAPGLVHSPQVDR